MGRRVVITGMGALTPLNSKETPIENLVEEFWKKLIQGYNGVELLDGSSRIDLSEFPVSVGGLVKFDVSQYMKDTKLFDNKREVRQVDPFSRYALVAAHSALADAGLLQLIYDESQEKEMIHVLLNSEEKERTGVIIGTGVGGLSTIEKQKEILLNRGVSKASPMTIPMIMPNAASGNVAIRYGFSGPNYSTSSACASAAHAIYDSLLNILAGKADIMVAGGSECSVTPLGFSCFSLIKALSRNPSPDASRPFDKERDGFVMAEGSGILILEEYEHAKKRGAKVYAELLSAYANCDAEHITAPRRDGIQVRRAMRSALGEAGLLPDQIGYINAHGTSTKLNDIIESHAIIDVFGEHAFNGLLVSSTKSMTGHLLGATAAVEAIASIYSLKEGIVPPTIHYKKPDPELADSSGRHLDYVPNIAREKKLEAVMSNSLGFGGPNCILVFGKLK